MRTVTLVRTSAGDEGTFGMLMVDGGLTLHTLELPWRENLSGKSCVPPGTYVARWLESPKHGMCYHLVDVPGRSQVEIHSANWAGDVDKGFKCQLLGCIALGESVGVLEGQQAVLSSKDAVDAFNKEMAGDTFSLVIQGA